MHLIDQIERNSQEILMPRLVKNGKWVYGWAVVDAERDLVVPPRAWRNYGFQAGEDAVFIRGSTASGGFGSRRR